MRVLFIAPRLPWPADTGGKIRTLNILKQLTTFAEVDLVCFSFEPDDERHRRQLRQAMHLDVHLVPHRDPSLSRRIRQLLEPRPLSVAKYEANAMAAKIKSLLLGRVYDAAHIDHIHMAQYHPNVADLPCYIDDHNVEFKILERCANVEKNTIKKEIYRRQAAKMKVFETQALKDCSACGAVSEEDARILKDLASVAVHVVPNGVDTEYFKPQDAVTAKKEETALVYTGSMDWLPNEDAVLFMVKDILPLLWAKNPDIIFYIVGKNPSPQVRALTDQEKRIVVTGSVDDVRPYIASVQVFVCPLRIGGGTRLKILEAMSMEKAVVATRVGAEGIDYQDRIDIAVEDEPQAFADRVLALLDDPMTRRKMGENGRRLVVKKYDWHIVGKKLREIYKTLGQIKSGQDDTLKK